MKGNSMIEAKEKNREKKKKKKIREMRHSISLCIAHQLSIFK